MMERFTSENPQTNMEILLNFAYVKNSKVCLRWADGMENVGLCEYIANNACCTAVDADAVMDGACLECDNRASALYRTAVQAAELRARLGAYEDTGLTPERCAELAKADKDGRLVVLPCKVGDTVFVNGTKRTVQATIDEAYLDDTKGIEYLVSFACEGDCDGCPFSDWKQDYSGEYSCDGEWGKASISGSDIGKTIFSSREEAEAALKEAEKDG